MVHRSRRPGSDWESAVAAAPDASVRATISADTSSPVRAESVTRARSPDILFRGIIPCPTNHPRNHHDIADQYRTSDRDHMKALVTGGAGLIGSHIVDLARAQGWEVRILDRLEPYTHRQGRPAWVPEDAEFIEGDVRDRGAWERALEGVDIVFHEAAYGGYMPEIAKFIEVNSLGTALMLETIRERDLPIRKIVVASSQAVYNEGAYHGPTSGRFYGTTRPDRPARRRRLRHARPGLRRGRHPHPDRRGRADGRREHLRHLQGRPGEADALVRPRDRHPRRRPALLLHLRPAPVDLQPLHRRDRHLLYPADERPPAARLRGRPPVPRPDLRRGHRPGEHARRD